MTIMQVLLKCADLGHTAAPLPMHKAWLLRLDEELLRQGDLMKGLPDAKVPAFMDRAAGSPLSSSQVRRGPCAARSEERAADPSASEQVPFYDTVIMPLYEALEALLPGAQFFVDGAAANFNHWQSMLPRA